MEMDARKRDSSCSRYEGLLVDYPGGERNTSGAERLEEHLRGCVNCRDAFENSRDGGRLLRAAAPFLDRAPEPRPEFARVVMARIRMDKAERAFERVGFWQPFVSLAWRFAATATIALVILLTYAVRGRTGAQPAVVALNQGGLADVFSPDPTRVPVDQDEILMMVADSGHGNN